MRRAAFSLAEALIAFTVATTVLAMLMALWSSSHRYSAQLEDRFTRLSAAQTALTVLAREIQACRRLMYPAVSQVAPALSLVDPQGTLVSFSVERSDPGRPGTLVRAAESKAPAARILPGVKDILFRIPAVPRGRDPDLVNITLILEGLQGKPLYLITSARVRAPVPSCPIER